MKIWCPISPGPNLYPSKAVWNPSGRVAMSARCCAPRLGRETNAPLAANAVPTIPATAAVPRASFVARVQDDRAEAPSPRFGMPSLYVVARLDAPLPRRGVLSAAIAS